MLACQQKVPAPSKVKGAVMVDVTGLHAPTRAVGVMLGVTVRVLVGPVVGVPGVRVDVLTRVGVRVAVNAAVGVPSGVGVRVAVSAGVNVRVGVTADVFVTVAVRVSVLVAPTSVRVGVRVRLGVRLGVRETPGVLVAP